MNRSLEIEQALESFAHAVRSGSGATAETWRAFETLLASKPSLTVKTTPDALVCEGVRGRDRELAALLHREGIRRIDLISGLTREELDALVEAIASGAATSCLDDDIATRLWRANLVNVRHIAESLSASRGSGAKFRDDAGALDTAARALAESLDRLDEAAPGLHAPRQLGPTPAYAGSIKEEIAAATAPVLASRVAELAIDALHGKVTTEDGVALHDVLLLVFNDALAAKDWELSGRLIAIARVSAARPAAGGSERLEQWIDRAVADAREAGAPWAVEEPQP